MATPESIPLERSDQYTVAWIAALAHERAAAEILLGQEHGLPKDFVQHPSDQNSYSWGRMSSHNIVIASLPGGEYGSVSTADTVSGLRASLPHIRVGLFVGIGAGVTGETPGIDEHSGKTLIKRDIRLGDICVSQPDRANGGVVQYDLYKSKVDENGNSFRELKGFLAAPPRALRSALSALQAKHERVDPSLIKYLEVFQQNKRTQKYMYPGSTHPDPLRTLISDGKVIYHDDLENRVEPEIHYGTIGAGNELLKDKAERDHILSWLQKNHIDPICFEMEASGIMNSFPSLIIRGICDYGDERKNDAWQRYAAATAAAFAKEFLEKLNPQEVKQTPSIEHVLGALAQVDRKLDSVHESTFNLQKRAVDLDFVALLNWLVPHDHSSVYAGYLSKRMSDSGSWFLEHPKLTSLIEGKTKVLYCPGVPGAGKTFMATGVIDHAMNSKHRTPMTVLYFFFDHSFQSQQTEENFLATLLRQATRAQGAATQSLVNLQAKHETNQTDPSKTELETSLVGTLMSLPKTVAVVDALDESSPSTRAGVLRFISKTANHPHTSWLLTSRDYPEIRTALSDYKELAITVSSRDVEDYCKSVAQDQHVRIPPKLFHSIVETVKEKAGGVFLLVRLHVSNIFSKTNVRDIRSALHELPKDRNGAYEATMYRIVSQSPERRSIACAALAWVSLNEEKLSMQALQEALAVRPGDQNLDREGMPSGQLIISVCAGLLSWEYCVRFSHFTTQEYMRETRDTWFPDARLDVAFACITYTYFPEVNLSNKYALAIHATRFKEVATWVGLQETEEIRSGPPYPISTSITHILLRAILEPELRRPYRNCGLYPSRSWHILAFWGLITAVQDKLEVQELDDADEYGNTALHYAVRTCQTMTVSLLLELGANPCAQNREKQTALHVAAIKGDAAISRRLLESGADLDARNSQKKTPIEVSITEGHTQAVALFLEWRKHGSNPTAVSDFGLYCLAIKHEKLDIVELLMDSLHIDMSTVTGQEGSSAFDRAFRYELGLEHRDSDHQKCWLPTIRQLIRCPGTDLNLLDDKDMSYLAQACKVGAEELVIDLLRSPTIDVCAGVETPLAAACGSGHTTIVERLLDVPHIDANAGKQTPLSYACDMGSGDLITNLLSSYRNNVYADVEAPLATACGFGHTTIVGRLLDTPHIDANAGKQTPLSYACDMGSGDLVTNLPSSDRNNVYASMETPLAIACRLGHVMIVERLLRVPHIDVNAGERTPLSYACEFRHMSIVKQLLKLPRVDVSLLLTSPLMYATPCDPSSGHYGSDRRRCSSSPSDLLEDLGFLLSTIRCSRSPKILVSSVHSAYNHFVSHSRSSGREPPFVELHWKPACAAAALEVLAPDIIGANSATKSPLNVQQNWNLELYSMGWTRCGRLIDVDRPRSEVFPVRKCNECRGWPKRHRQGN